jgi:hypothetical protein
MVATLLNFVVVGKGMVKIIERLEVPHSIDLLGMTLRDIDTELQLELSTSRTLASLMIPERYRHGMKN